jgi:hypothetical protein
VKFKTWVKQTSMLAHVPYYGNIHCIIFSQLTDKNCYWPSFWLNCAHQLTIWTRVKTGNAALENNSSENVHFYKVYEEQIILFYCTYTLSAHTSNVTWICTEVKRWWFLMIGAGNECIYFLVFLCLGRTVKNMGITVLF